MSLTKFLEMYLKDIKLFLDFSKTAEGYIDIDIFNDLVSRYYKRLKLKRINEVLIYNMVNNNQFIRELNRVKKNLSKILFDLQNKICSICPYFIGYNCRLEVMWCKVNEIFTLHNELKNKLSDNYLEIYWLGRCEIL